MKTTISIIAFLNIFLIVLFTGCTKDDTDVPENIDFRQEMRNFVIDIAAYAKNQNSDFIIIPQNGQELITNNGESDGAPYTSYLQAIDATGRESMFYGYYNDDEETPFEDRQHLLNLCLVCEQHNVEVLATDYCSTVSKMDDSYQKNDDSGFISFAADKRDLNNIPDYPETPYNENSEDILDISQAGNFLYLINSENFTTKQDFVAAISETNYDILIMDLFHNDEAYTHTEITQLKKKKNGGKRLVICYISIGEAEDYRYYWQVGWSSDKPVWLDAENPDWAGNYKVRYWESDWQRIIQGNDDSYIKKIIDSGFDGAYLDIVDGFEYYEENDNKD